MPIRFSRIFAVCMFLLSIMSVHALAQVDTPKVEVGVHFAFNRLRIFDPATNDIGVGGRLTFNINDAIAVEGEYNYFPREAFGGLSSSQSQGFIGVKTGLRSETAGIFFKMRPGFAKFSGTTTPPLCTPALHQPIVCKIAGGPTQFAFDIGGVFELYPIRRTVVRFDVGDTMIRFGSILEAPDGYTAHNLQFNIGIGFRF